MGKDDNTWLRICYVAFFLLITFIGKSAANMLGIQMGWVERYDAWYPAAQTVFGLLLAAGLTYYFANDKERREYHLACIAELRKVTWPSWPDVKRMTVVVCIVVAVFAVILGVFDFLWAGALAQLMTS